MKCRSAIILLLAVHSAFGQSPLSKQWDARFGGTFSDLLTGFIQTADDGYLLYGYSKSLAGGDKSQTLWGGQGDDDFWLVKLDNAGNKQWDKDLGGEFSDRLFSVKQTADGGYFLAGESISGISGDKSEPVIGNTDYWILKLDSLGNKIWDKDFGGSEHDYLNSCAQTSDGGFIIGGISLSPAGGDKTQNGWGGWDYWIIKIDSAGNKQWDRDYGGTEHDYLNALQQTADGGYVFGGYSLSDVGGDKTDPNWGLYDFWIIKTDSLGNIQWDSDLGGYSNDYFNALQQTSDNGYILAGISESGPNGDKTQPTYGGLDYWIVKLDPAGNFEWDYDYGGDDDEDFFGSVQQEADGGYLLCGISYSNLSGNKSEDNLGIEQSWIIKTDDIGGIVWDKTIFTLGHDEEGFALKNRDGCYVIANNSTSHVGGYHSQDNRDTTPAPYTTSDYWIVTFCDSTLTTGVSEIQNDLFKIYPNPASTTLTIEIQSPLMLSIYNVLGKVVMEKEFFSTTFSKYDIDISSLNNGMYIVRSGDKVGRFLKQ
jgi:hypothetical protein